MDRDGVLSQDEKGFPWLNKTAGISARPSVESVHGVSVLPKETRGFVAQSRNPLL